MQVSIGVIVVADSSSVGKEMAWRGFRRAVEGGGCKRLAEAQGRRVMEGGEGKG